MITRALSAQFTLLLNALSTRFLRRPDFQEAAQFACTLRIYTRNKNILCVKKLCYFSILFEDVTFTMINGNTVTCQ